MFLSRELEITYVRKHAEILSISAQESVQQFITPDGQTTCDDSKGSKRTPRLCSSAARGSAEVVAAEGVPPQDPAAGNCWRVEGGVEKRKNSGLLGFLRSEILQDRSRCGVLLLEFGQAVAFLLYHRLRRPLDEVLVLKLLLLRRD